MNRRLRLCLAALLLLVLACSGCGGAGDEPSRTSMPEGLTAYVDQGRLFRMTRTAYVRLVNEPERFVTVTRAEVRSDRFDEVVWTGEKTFQNEADLPFEMPRGRCGTGSDAEVTLTYRLDDGPWRVSTTTARDRYGAIGLFLDRDCAEQTLIEAADVELGEPRVVGSGRGSVWELPVTMTPTGVRDDVAFGGFDDTVLFRQVAGSPSLERIEPIPLTGGAVRVVLRLAPTRCDPHALAEDKVGTLVGVRVIAADLADGSAYFLPIGDQRRAHLRGFFASHCGL